MSFSIPILIYINNNFSNFSPSMYTGHLFHPHLARWRSDTWSLLQRRDFYPYASGNRQLSYCHIFVGSPASCARLAASEVDIALPPLSLASMSFFEAWQEGQSVMASIRAWLTVVVELRPDRHLVLVVLKDFSLMKTVMSPTWQNGHFTVSFTVEDITKHSVFCSF